MAMALELQAAERFIDALKLLAADPSHDCGDGFDVFRAVKGQLVAVDRRIRVYDTLAAKEPV